jgi:putative transposase
MVSPAAKREAAAWLQTEFEVSQRRACRVLSLNLATCRYESRRGDGGIIRQRLCALAEERPKWGYRFLHNALRRAGFAVNHKRVCRLYRLEGLALRRKRRKRVMRVRRPLEPAARLNERWSMDFMSDQLADGRRLRTFNVIDNFSREGLAIDVATSIPGARVVAVLDRIAAERGYPESIVMDNGPEYTGRALDQWAYSHGVRLDFIQPGKPTQNGFAESFNGTVRTECLDTHWFISIQHARRILEDYRRDYNERRPHSSLGYLTPAEFAQRHQPPAEAVAI